MFDVTLTFDNGPEPDVTPTVLDTLAREDIKATFFVLGHKIAEPAGHALMERAHAEGHWIGNHTYTHATPLGRLDGLDVPETEIGRTQALIGGLAHPEKWFRPFGGGGAIGPHLLSRPVLEFLKAGGYSCVLWNVIPRDWAEPDAWVDTAMELMAPLPWSLIVIHDLPTGAMDRLPEFIARVRAAGGRFRQDFPPDCLPLRAGRETCDMTPYVTPWAVGAA